MNFLKIVSSEDISEQTISNYIPRTILQIDEIKSDVEEIIARVKQEGDRAILSYTTKFDKVKLKSTEILVRKEEISEAYELVDQSLIGAIQAAKKNLITFHQAQKRDDWSITIDNGINAGQIYRPIESVGIYVPGGRAVYPSTVLMTASPALVAGVKEIVLCSPPQLDGNVSPAILVAANEFGIKRIYKVGGAQAIAAMAYGSDTIPSVQKIVGPGNKWVNACKQLVSNVVAIDTPAGPSEILIIADKTTNIDYVMLDLISQVEHDPDNIGIVVSTSSELLENFNQNIVPIVQRSERKQIIESALKNNSLLIKARDLDDCVRISNIIAPEHLQIMTQKPRSLLEKIVNAGAIFLGPYSPVPLGDYSAGTNHVLPTGGNAKKYSGLNTLEFLKIIDVLECDKEGLKQLSASATILAQFEGLVGHKESIEERLKDDDSVKSK